MKLNIQKLIRILFFVIAFSLTANLGLFGQNQTQLIRGKVIDEDTQIPLIGATISVLNLESLIGTTTNEEGTFRLEEVPIGRVNLVVSYIGYQDKWVQFILSQSAKKVIFCHKKEQMTKAEFIKKMTAHWDKLETLKSSSDLYELEKGFDEVWTQAGNQILNGIVGEPKTEDRRKKNP